MESDKPDLNSILESARAQLEMYRRASQEDLNEPKEIILARTKDQEMEDISGPLFDRAKDSSAAVECSRANSGKSVESQNRSSEPSKETEDSRTNSEMDAEGVDVEGEESSNKNFDSSTMTLGDQGSFQNQAELTSQTTYTNIHDLTGPVPDDILVVTSPISEIPEDPNLPSQISQNPQETVSETISLNMTTASDITSSAASDSLNKQDDSQHNQMAFIRGWKSDPCRDTKDTEIIVPETLPHEKTWDEALSKGYSAPVAGAGTREGSPIRTSAKLIQEVADRLSQLEVEGNDCSWLQNSLHEEGVDCLQTSEVSKDSANSTSEDSASVKTESANKIKIQGVSIFDNPSSPPSVNLNSVTNRQLEFVEHFEESEADKLDANIMKVSDKSLFEDEGFVDSKDLMDSTKVIFISDDQDDEQSCKPFETEDDISCLLEPSSAGRSLDLHSDLEAKPSLTDIHPMEQENIRDDFPEVDTDFNRVISLHSLRADSHENQDIVDDEPISCQENESRTNKEQEEIISFDDAGVSLAPVSIEEAGITLPPVPLEDTGVTLTPVTLGNTSKKLEDNLQKSSRSDKTHTVTSVSTNKDHVATKSQSDSQKASPKTPKKEKNSKPVDQKSKPRRLSEENKKLNSPPPTKKSSKTPPCTPKVNKVHSKDSKKPPDQSSSKKQPKCIGKAIFEMFYKSISEGKSPLPPHLTAILQKAYAPENQEEATCVNPPVLNESRSGTDYESANESSDKSIHHINSSKTNECKTNVETKPPTPVVTVNKAPNKSRETPKTPVSKNTDKKTKPKITNSDDRTTIVNPISTNDLKIRPSITITPISMLQTGFPTDSPQITNESETVILTSNPSTPSSVESCHQSANIITADIPLPNLTLRDDVDHIEPIMIPDTEIQLLPEPEVQLVPPMQKGGSKQLVSRPLLIPLINEKRAHSGDISVPIDAQLRKTDFLHIEPLSTSSSDNVQPIDSTPDTEHINTECPFLQNPPTIIPDNQSSKESNCFIENPTPNTFIPIISENQSTTSSNFAPEKDQYDSRKSSARVLPFYNDESTSEPLNKTNENEDSDNVCKYVPRSSNKNEIHLSENKSSSPNRDTTDQFSPTPNNKAIPDLQPDGIYKKPSPKTDLEINPHIRRILTHEQSSSTTDIEFNSYIQPISTNKPINDEVINPPNNPRQNHAVDRSDVRKLHPTLKTNKDDESHDNDNQSAFENEIDIHKLNTPFTAEHQHKLLLPPLEPTSEFSIQEERPLTPYVSEIRPPAPDISHYIQEPQIPIIRPPSPFGPPEIRFQTPEETVQRNDPVVPAKTPPPRPPPRARHTTQPQKKKLNFFKKLFGVKTKSSH